MCRGLSAGIVLLACAVSASAQATAPSRATDRAAAGTRYQVRVMEGVLERAVQHGAQGVALKPRQVSPDLMAFSGPARARGSRLEGRTDAEAARTRELVNYMMRVSQQPPR